MVSSISFVYCHVPGGPEQKGKAPTKHLNKRYRVPYGTIWTTQPPFTNTWSFLDLLDYRNKLDQLIFGTPPNPPFAHPPFVTLRYSLGGCSLGPPMLDPGTYSMDWESTVWESPVWEVALWEAAVSGHRLWNLGPLRRIYRGSLKVNVA